MNILWSQVILTVIRCLAVAWTEVFQATVKNYKIRIRGVIQFIFRIQPIHPI